MYDLIRIKDNIYIIDGYIHLGLITVGEREAILIDSGNDSESGRKIRQLLEREGLTLKAIYNTHAHADHIGGNAYLERRYGCKIFTSSKECGLINAPTLSSALMYGSLPPLELQNKILVAKASMAEVIRADSLESGITTIDLSGHSPGMLGFLCRNVAFIADSVQGRETLNRYKLPYVYSVKDYLSSLDRLLELDAELFVPSHSKAVRDIKELATYNREAIATLALYIERLCSKPSSLEELVKGLYSRLDIHYSATEHLLLLSSVRAFLTYLLDSKRICTHFIDGIEYFSA